MPRVHTSEILSHFKPRNYDLLGPISGAPCVITGQAGSGKTTTLSMLIINDNASKRDFRRINPPGALAHEMRASRSTTEAGKQAGAGGAADARSGGNGRPPAPAAPKPASNKAVRD
mmetsp:Transcript_2668/g.6811  ORF Transcript_2668/g.6811 Transcript_2668/m.6811 type:complete len:116 (+) Transcript_2668:29-376(+)